MKIGTTAKHHASLRNHCALTQNSSCIKIAHIIIFQLYEHFLSFHDQSIESSSSSNTMFIVSHIGTVPPSSYDPDYMEEESHYETLDELVSQKEALLTSLVNFS